MKRWWLLALPYVVTVSTQPKACTQWVPAMLDKDGNATGVTCKSFVDPKRYEMAPLQPCTDTGVNNCEWMLDAAQAMNDAHTKRLKNLK